jgi:hypothetical protein
LCVVKFAKSNVPAPRPATLLPTPPRTDASAVLTPEAIPPEPPVGAGAAEAGGVVVAGEDGDGAVVDGDAEEDAGDGLEEEVAEGVGAGGGAAAVVGAALPTAPGSADEAADAAGRVWESRHAFEWPCRIGFSAGRG